MKKKSMCNSNIMHNEYDSILYVIDFLFFLQSIGCIRNLVSKE